MDVARLFFHPPGAPKRVSVVALASHVENVARLAQAWSPDLAYRAPSECDLAKTQAQLLEAAHRHDEAKPVTFRVTHDDGRWGYSFAGHRFRVSCDDLYVGALVEMHHEFSVDGVAEWQARLRRELDNVHAANFPFDLYTLEMCDQVAAEAESYAFSGDADERAFMELHSRKRQDDPLTVEVEPFPFAPSPLPLVVAHAEFTVSDDLRTPPKLTEALKQWAPDDLLERTVTLCSP